MGKKGDVTCKFSTALNSENRLLIKKTPHSLSSVQHALTKVEHETNSVNIKTRDYNTSDLKDILRATSTSSSTFD